MNVRNLHVSLINLPLIGIPNFLGIPTCMSVTALSKVGFWGVCEVSHIMYIHVMAGKDWPFHHGHAPPWRKKSPRSRSFFLLSPRIFLVVLSSRSYDDVSDDVTPLLMTWHSTDFLKSCTVQLYSTMDSMGTRARGWR